MAGRWDLGLPSAAAMAMLTFVHVISLVVRRRLRLAQARKEEVEQLVQLVQLVQLAAQEMARAEMGATLAHGPASPAPVEVRGGGSVGCSRRFECAVCRRFTNTRCSHCRAIRYCSGTCQIVHWRRGHKYECYRSQVRDDDIQNTRSFFSSSALESSFGSSDSSSSFFSYPSFFFQKNVMKLLPMKPCICIIPKLLMPYLMMFLLIGQKIQLMIS